jgi:WD40 repeat protein
MDSAFEKLLSASLLARASRQDLAALLAVEAYRLRPGEARSAVFSTFTRNEGFVGYHSISGASALSAVAAVGSEDHVVALIDGARLVELDGAGRVVRTLGSLPIGDPLRADLGNMVRVSADGSIVLAAAATDSAAVWRTWSLETGEPLGPIVTLPFDDANGELSSTDPTSFRGFSDAALSTNGALVAFSGGLRGHVRVLRADDGEPIGDLLVEAPSTGWASWPISGHTAAVVFDADDELLAGGPTGEIIVTAPLDTSVDTLPIRARIAGSVGGAEWRIQLTAGEGGPALVTSGSQTVARIDLDSETVVWSTRVHSVNPLLGTAGPFEGLNPCRDIAISQVANTVFCADDFGSIFGVDLSAGAVSPQVHDRQTGITGSVAVSRDGRQLVAGSFTSGALAVWLLSGGGPIQRVAAAGTGSTSTSGYDASGTLLANAPFGDLDGYEIVDTDTDKVDAVAPPIFFLGWSAENEQYWAFDASKGAIRLVNATTGASTLGPAIQPHEGNLSFFRDDTHHRVFIVWPDLALVLDTDAGVIGASIVAPTQPGRGINSVASGADASTILVSSWQGTQAYDAATGTPIAGMWAPQLINTAVSADGIGAGAAADGGLVLFDAATLKTIADLPASHGYLLQLQFSTDGALLAVSNNSDGIRLFDAAMRTQLGDAIPVSDEAFGWAFSLRGDGRELAVPDGPLGAVLWNLDVSSWLDAACAVAGRNLTPEEWEPYLADFGDYHETCTAGHANVT